MRRITDILSKEVVSVAEGEIIGIVTNGYTDEKLSRVRGFKVSCEGSDDALALPLRRILGTADALTVMGSSSLKGFEGRECPLGVKVFDTEGTCLGALRDLLFDEANGVVTALSVEGSELPPDSVIRFGRNALLLRAPTHAGKLFRRLSAHPRKRVEKPRRMTPLPSVRPAASKSPSAESPLSSPKHDYAFLLGRSVLRTIGSEDGPIAQAGDVVTPEILWKAGAKGKLVELTVNSKRG